MSSGPIRRSQLVAPFGVGALVVVPNGTSLIAAGLDHWFEREDTGTDTQGIDLDEYRLEEWRLQAELHVNHFRLPPDWRTPRGYGQPIPNLRLPVPFLRFPGWNFCPRCDLLQPQPLTARGKVRCAECSRTKGPSPYVLQVPFVAICSYGHIRDFPWREWVHYSAKPTCNEPLRLRTTGGASLAAQTIECACGKRRTLAGITEAASVGSAEYPGTYLSSQLEAGEEFLCDGRMPWHGTDEPGGCGEQLRGSLRAASNLYYALVRSSIYLPRQTESVPEKLIQILDNPPLSTLIHQLTQAGATPEPSFIRGQQRELLQPYTDAQIRDALRVIQQPITPSAAVVEDQPALTDETEFRRPEHSLLRRDIANLELQIRHEAMAAYSPAVADVFDRIMLVDRLRETRALYGFNRIFPEGDEGLADRKALLRRAEPSWDNNWLPAYVVHGEGIFAELEPNRVASWEQREDVRERVARLQQSYDQVALIRHLKPRLITPRFVLLHTLAHMLMNQLTFECGYSSAALRERLYVAAGDSPMAGFLIYTAAGDAEGTMGGLVRMGKPGNFEPTFVAANEGARWCSADPVCMELGEAGQGPDSCNLAACHNCALVPETACEEFNRFLDRGLLVGTHSNPGLGFFSRA